MLVLRFVHSTFCLVFAELAQQDRAGFFKLDTAGDFEKNIIFGIIEEKLGKCK